jgi:hypothetical protein
MEAKAEIAQAIALLENINDYSTPPAVFLLPPDSGEFIHGNEGGFVYLAIASLRAAQGEKQSFKNAPWVGSYEFDWFMHGLCPDSEAHVYLPTKQRKLNDKILLFVAAIVGIAILACFSVGLVDIIHLMFKR